eukprot:COSAG04_NODE_288_length_17855_cov_32.496621_7_plen_648_part_00
MTRKLCVIGLLSVVSQGSTFQICAGVLTSFIFFAGHVRSLPYRHWEDNVLKAATEFHLFLIMVLVLALKTDLSSETYSESVYDTVAFVLWVLFVPVAFLACLWSKWRAVVQNDISQTNMTSKLRILEEAFRRYRLGRDKVEDRQLLDQYITLMKETDSWELQEAGLYHEPSDSLCSDRANIFGDTLVCRGEYQSMEDAEPAQCAVKVRPRELQTLVTENSIRLECNHKNICGMIGTVETATSHYLILKLCSTSLQEAVDAGKLQDALGSCTPLSVCSGVIEAIGALHGARFIHGNCTPSNVLLDESGTPKLSGFSCAAQLRDDGSCTLCTARCTPGFSPAEVSNTKADADEDDAVGGWRPQADSQDSDAVEVSDAVALDVFSLGVTLSFVLSDGSLAFQTDARTAEDRLGAVQRNIQAGSHGLTEMDRLSAEAKHLLSLMVSASPSNRPALDTLRGHPTFWSLPNKIKYLGETVGSILPPRKHKSEVPFVSDLEDEVDKALGGPYNGQDPAAGTSWARLLDPRYPLAGANNDGWGKGQRSPVEEEGNYAIYGTGAPSKKQQKEREGLVAAGKPLGTHEAKEIRSVGLLKFIRNCDAHGGQMVSAGRFESEDALQHYLLDPFPWLLMAVWETDKRHGLTGGGAPGVAG